MISFVIPAYNEELELPATIAAIQRAVGADHDYEIVVVDDGSTDATARIAFDAGARVIPIHRRHIAASRNAGGRAGHGDVLIFVDADTRISSAHVSGVLDALTNGFAGGGARVTTKDVPMWGSVFVYLFCKLYFAANIGAGAFLFTTRENFERAGGFDEQYFAGEEVYFTRALKKLGRFIVLREPVVTSGRKLRMHTGRELFVQLWRMTLAGPSACRSRDRLGVWYDGKRETADTGSL